MSYGAARQRLLSHGLLSGADGGRCTEWGEVGADRGGGKRVNWRRRSRLKERKKVDSLGSRRWNYMPIPERSYCAMKWGDNIRLSHHLPRSVAL